MKWLGFLTVLGAIAAGCSGGGGPEIMPIDDVSVFVNDTVIVDLRVATAAGDETWSFSAPTLPDIARHANIYQSGGSATFRWIPLASHAGQHQFSFTVTTSKGSDSETINIIVRPIGGVPRFIQPSRGGTFNLSENPCVDVDIEVMDEDSTNVTIREGDPRVQGGQMNQTDPFRARWHWCPTPAQMDSTLRYTLHLEADDSSNPPVRHVYDIVLLDDDDKPDCPGAAPQITATSAAANPYETNRDYEVSATINDDQGLKDMPVLHYSTNPPDMSNPDVTRMDAVTFENVAGAEYRAYIPNLGLADGQERIIYYVVRATDNDDAEGTRCDHATQSPVNQFVARPGTDHSVYCDPCSNDGQCMNGLCVVSAADTGAVAPSSFCGQDCDPAAGCTEGVCRSMTSRGGLTATQCVPEGLDCDGGGGEDCTDDAYEDASDAEASAPSYTVGTSMEGQICPGDLDFYAVTLTADTEYEFYATGWNADTTDLDFVLRSPSGAALGVGADTTDEEFFSACATETGRHIIEIEGYDASFGPYLFEMNATTGSCCEDDEHEENDTRDEAASIVCGFGAEALMCDGDEDWWSFTATSPMSVDIDMVCDAGSGDLDIQLYDSIGTRLGSSTAGTCDESLTATLPASGTYYVRVFSFFDTTGSYLIDCAEGSTATCTETRSCPSGTVCNPSEGCVAETCTAGVTTCPVGHFCPTAGLAGESSACVESCLTSADCRSGYECKIFADGRGCAPEGSGQTGQPCRSFSDCQDERICLNAPPTGYCAEINCFNNADCPSDSHTFASRCVSVGGQNICLMDCLAGDDQCDINPGTCTTTRDMEGSAAWVCALPEHRVPPF